MNSLLKFVLYFWVLQQIAMASTSDEACLTGRPPARDIRRVFDFPADEAQLLQYRDSQNNAAMRKHAWNVFAGMTRMKHGKAVWETWYTGDEVFDCDSSKQLRETRKFEIPKQFLIDTKSESAGQDLGVGLLSRMLFNKAARTHIVTHKLHVKTTLQGLNDSYAEREIPPFPRTAVAVKTIWVSVKQMDKYTVLPVWNPENPPAGDYSGPGTWKDCVAVAFSHRHTIPVTVAVDCNQQPSTAKLYSLADFHHIHLNKEQIQGIKETPALNHRFGDLKPGDALILVALHLTTKEIGDWVWATFWWHNRPDASPFGSDRTPNIRGAWRNYRMDTTLSMDTPPDGTGGPKVCFNPWLEGPLDQGTTANCMTCHARAAFPPGAPGREGNVVTRGSESLCPSDFRGKLKLDFMWSLLRAH